VSPERQALRKGEKGEETHPLLEMLQRAQHHHPQQEEKMRVSAGWHEMHATLAVLRRDLL
jgi:hypothetical protein